MIQNGGWLVSKDGKTATVNSAANVKAFNFVKSMINDGSMKLTNQLGAGWGGEGFGNQKCAMTIEGNWISGAMYADYPTVAYKVVAASRRPGRQGDAAVRRRLGHGRRLEEQDGRDEPDHVPDLARGAAGQREGVRRHAVGRSASAKRGEALPAVRVLPRRCRLLEEHPDGRRTSGRSSATSTSSCRRCRHTIPKTILDRVQQELQSVLG